MSFVSAARNSILAHRRAFCKLSRLRGGGIVPYHAAMSILVTGAAGFIGFHISRALLARGESVIGVDNLNAYYDVALKQARLARLQRNAGFTFLQRDIAEETPAEELAAAHFGIETIVHMAAQAGVRHSLEAPFTHARSNLHGQVVLCELARRLQERQGLRHFLFASSSSVYGGNDKLPFSVEDPVANPLSLYAATKCCGEVLVRTYARLFSFPATGLRFFTVYGPWGRPDMALFQFTRAILEGRPVTLFNHGDMQRDFTYIDDAVDGVLRALDTPPPPGSMKLYNLGNHRMESLRSMVAALETALGKQADKRFAAMQPGDAVRTCADITESECDLGFHPRTGLQEGVARFVAWYRDFYGA